jgi:sugar phosphate isomerase/epimerase
VSRDPISVQLYSVREAVAQSLPSALDRLAALGFTTVELYGFVDRAEEYKKALDSAGLQAPSAHAPVLAAEDPSRIFDAALTVGASTVIDPHHPEEHWQTGDDVRANAERMNRLAQAAGEQGLRFGYHNHHFELASSIDGRPALEVLADELDPAVVLEVDAFWSQVGGVDAPALLQRLGDRVGFIHVKDGPITRDTSTQQPAGQGEMDLPAVLAAAPQVVRVVEFDAYSGDVFDGLAQSLAWLAEHDR